MKRCPKCNRTFPDENQKFCTFDGGLLIGQPAFDPNVTIRATAAEVELPPAEPPRPAKSTSRELPSIERASRRDFNPNETIAASAPTAFFPRSPGGNQTSANLPPPPPPPVNVGAITASSALSQPAVPSAAAVPPAKKSKLPWILGALLVLLLLGGGGLAAVFFVVVKPRLEEMSQPRVQTEPPPTVTAEQPNSNVTAEASPAEETKTAETAETYVPPADARSFANSKDNLDGKLAEQYVDFHFYYPGSWQTDPQAGIRGASNFVRVFKTAKDETGEYTPESVAVSWYTSTGTYESDVSVFPSRVRALSSQLAKSLPNYRKVSEGPTQVNSLKAYEFHFTGVSNEPDQGELPYWGRVIFIPPGVEGQKTGVSIIMLATSKAEGVTSEADVGVKGEMPIMLESFRFGRKD
jgi:hypothetical protein